MKEIWKDIPGYEDLYQVSNIGNIRIKNYRKSGKPKIRKASNNKCGYIGINLIKDGKAHYHLVHRLVYSAFIGTIPEGMQINHINEIKSDNRICNLNLMTPMENCNWGTHIQRCAESRKKPILMLDKKDNFLREFKSTIDACEFLEIEYAHKHINDCLKKRRNSAYGFKWKYKDEI